MVGLSVLVALALAEAAQAARGGSVLIRSHHTCDDGSGTFDALKHIQLTFTDAAFTDVGATA